MKEKIMPYWQALYNVLQYQIVTKIALSFWIYLLGKILNDLLQSTGRVAVSSGDFTFLFTTWQGLCIILVGLGTLLVYVALDLNTKILLSGNLLRGESGKLKETFKKALRIMPRFLVPEGIGVILYIALISPLLGFGLSISLTHGFHIPTFITSVIHSTPLYRVLTIIVLILFFSMGLANIFIMHGVILDDLSLKDASKLSRKLMKDNKWDYLKQNIMYVLFGLVMLAVIILLTIVLPLFLIDVIPMSPGLKRGLTLFVMLLGTVVSTLAALFATPLYTMKLTQLYYTYKEGKQVYYPIRKREKHPYIIALAVGVVIALTTASVILTNRFDEVFPAESTTRIIAHRAGGNEAPENTVAGIEKAYELGAYGCEIDIQRTEDGHYVILHDGNFKRVANDKRKPENMTLEEVKKLSVDGEPIPTFEEMLEASKGKVVLFTELKGNTADKKMADDAVRIVKEMGMEDEVILISLKYELIDYIESTYPEIQTAYLTWLSFGDTGALNSDYIGLEEESGTADAINAIHKQGKGALIWTSNDKQSQHRFLCSDADCLITDNVKQAVELKEELVNRSDIERILDKLMSL